MSIINEIINNTLSMVSYDRLVNLHNHCLQFRNTDFSFVECGVAKGGCLAIMKSISKNNKVFGFDSFEGMPMITEKDIGEYNKNDPINGYGKPGDNLSGGIDSVYTTFEKLNLTTINVTLIKGYFQKTLAVQETIDSIGKIAVLRLDSDWYESTKICLEKLYDNVIDGGVIIIDDYGYWVGAKRAVDEFRQQRNIISPLLQTDFTEYYWYKKM